MATVVFTTSTDGYIDYGISHRFFRIGSDGEPWGAAGRLADPYEVGLIRNAVTDTVTPDVTTAVTASPYVVDPANPTDDELAAALERGLADGTLIDAADWLAANRPE
jgi:hypothetical protein